MTEITIKPKIKLKYRIDMSFLSKIQDYKSIKEILATKTCIESICKSKIKKDIISISAGNYGGKLGQYHFHLRKIMK